MFASALGLVGMLFVAWLCSRSRRDVQWRLVVAGMVMSFAMAILILKVPFIRDIFQWMGDMVTKMIGYVDVGSEFVFGKNFRDHFFAFKVIPSVIFCSALITLLYHVKILPFFVRGMAWVMQKTMKVSGAESLSTVANVFLGMIEAPMTIRPYLPKMTRSELACVMVGGYSTVAGGVMAAYIGFGIDPVHLLAASFIAAPMTIVMSKIVWPEIETPETVEVGNVRMPKVAHGVLDAFTRGAKSGLQVALVVGTMLIVFVAGIAMVNGILGWCGEQFGMVWSFEAMLSPLFAPFAFLMGVPYHECGDVGTLLGLKISTNEFVAYERLSGMSHLSERSRTLATYALCGFANFSSIGITIGGMTQICKKRRKDIVSLAFWTMIVGAITSILTACVVGIIL